MKILLKYLQALKGFCKKLTYIDNFFENIEKIDPEKWVITQEFIEYLISLYDGVGKETELHSFHKKCESISKKYWLNDEDYDAVDGIMVELRHAKNKLVSFLFVASDQFKEIEKELFEIIVEVIGESLELELDIKHKITHLIKLILSSLV